MGTNTLFAWSGEKTAKGLRTAVDFYSSDMPKGGRGCEFHSIWELYNCYLEEGNLATLKYTPQPLKIRYKGRNGKDRFYIPDALVEGQEAILLEVKTRAELDESTYMSPECLKAVELLCQKRNWIFREIANESIAERIIAARNWQQISSFVLLPRPAGFDQRCEVVTEFVMRCGKALVSELISFQGVVDGDAAIQVISCCLWKGELLADLETTNWSTRMEVYAP